MLDVWSSSRAAPAWTAPTQAVVDVQRAAIHYSTWAGELADPVVLIHGTAANTSWWEPLAPHLSRARRVVAVDISGHGDSGHRDEYSTALWVAELAAVIRHACDGKAILIGHSMGGVLALHAAADAPDLIRGVVLVDSAVMRHPRQSRTPSAARSAYRSKAEALRAFRLLPDQPVADLTYSRYLAERSLTRRRGGWEWKFDPRIFGCLAGVEIDSILRRVGCPIAMVRGNLSTVVDSSSAAHVARLIQRSVASIEIPAAYHHVMVDQPAALLEALDEVLTSARFASGR